MYWADLRNYNLVIGNCVNNVLIRFELRLPTPINSLIQFDRIQCSKMLALRSSTYPK